MYQNKVGKVLELFISVNSEESRLEKETIALDDKGVCEDKFHDKDINRAILITSLESYRLAQKNDVQMAHGSLGENILIDYDLYHLKTGDRLKIGEVLLEITQNCTLCKGLSKVDPILPELLKRHRGIFAKTVTDGSIHIGDAVYL